jgi:hypothetical protein
MEAATKIRGRDSLATGNFPGYRGDIDAPPRSSNEAIDPQELVSFRPIDEENRSVRV